MNTNDLIERIAARAAQLADMAMTTLRSTNGYGCSTAYEAQQKDKGKSRGEIIEQILLEEFYEEFPRGIEDE